MRYILKIISTIISIVLLLNCSGLRQFKINNANLEDGNKVKELLKNPNTVSDPEELSNLSKIFFESEYWEASSYYIDQALTLNPLNGNFYFLKGEILVNTTLNDFEKNSFERKLVLRLAFEFYSIASKFVETSKEAKKKMEFLSEIIFPNVCDLGSPN
ncbi:MAG: hypothetical protein D8M58_00080 [Calditrichaeota bacterium]|nr:MAG: hypothetical protein DWQ03_07000 [Calditrichota bacterium]MBL1203766.1 hypothetical protein [Calditrichota bacterium]NOG43596.1 hypothetical protein [Calditrichota bacterium]